MTDAQASVERESKVRNLGAMFTVAKMEDGSRWFDVLNK